MTPGTDPEQGNVDSARPRMAARALAEKHGISLRTAQQYLRLGISPPPADCYGIGRDGKR